MHHSYVANYVSKKCQHLPGDACTIIMYVSEEAGHDHVYCLYISVCASRGLITIDSGMITLPLYTY